MLKAFCCAVGMSVILMVAVTGQAATISWGSATNVTYSPSDVTKVGTLFDSATNYPTADVLPQWRRLQPLCDWRHHHCLCQRVGNYRYERQRRASGAWDHRTTSI